MALTNIELYEALKKDLNEEAARMIAEVVPQASDIATKRDIAEVLHGIATLETTMERRFAESERHTAQAMVRTMVIFVGPLYAALIAEVVKLVLK